MAGERRVGQGLCIYIYIYMYILYIHTCMVSDGHIYIYIHMYTCSVYFCSMYMYISICTYVYTYMPGCLYNLL